MKGCLVALGIGALLIAVQAGSAADFNGDGTQDIGIYRPIQGYWAVRNITRAYLGSQNDSPVPADYTGDGCDDIAVYRCGNGLWAVRGVTRIYFGSEYDVPVSAVGSTRRINGNVNWSDSIFRVENGGNGPSVWGVNTGGGNAIRGNCFGGAGIAVYGEADGGQGIVGRSTAGNGVEGYSASGYGVFAHSDNSDSIYVDSAGANGVNVASAGSHGVYVGEAGWDGFAVYTAVVAGVWVHSAGQDGILVETAGWDGVHVVGPVGGAYYGSGKKGDEDFMVLNTGEVRSRVGFKTMAADFAEIMEVEDAGADYEPGDVLVISDEKDRAVEIASSAYSRTVAGVYSADPGFVGGRPVTGLDPEGSLPVAMLGIVPCKATAENGAIRRGDLLVTSSTPAHAMRADNPPPGTILGKALEPLDSDTGIILVFLTLQ